MFSGIFYVLLTFSIFPEGKSQGCGTMIYKSSEDNACYVSYENCSISPECTYHCDDKPNVTYVIDSDSGIMTAYFPLPPSYCCHTRYKVELLVDERIENASTCFENLSFSDKHSVRNYYIRKCENGSCGGDKCKQYGEVVFKYVFSGCYKLRIAPFIKSSSQAPLHSCANYIQTNFTKLKIADIYPTIGPIYRQKEQSVTLDVSYPQAISKTAIEFNFCENDSRVNGAVVSVKAGIDSNGSTCMPIMNVMDPKCINTVQEIHCKFYNVSPGNYCIRMTIDDDRCVPGTIWTVNNFCRWSHTLGIEHEQLDEPVVSIFSTSSITISLVIIVVGILFLAGLGIWLFKRRSLILVSTPVEPQDELIRPMIHKLKVLLLYPRDCKDFMDAMESLRKFLEKFHNVEVYDCYDSDGVLNGPLDWLRGIMSHPKLCTIIVTSQCAYLQQQAIQSGSVITNYSLYKEPNYLDTLFIYGLKLIMEDVSPNIYHKNYVIGFSGFSDDANMLSLPTSFRRYIIPEHLQKLLSDMNVGNCHENAHLENTMEYIVLQNSVRSLIDYKSVNPHYLEYILNLT